LSSIYSLRDEARYITRIAEVLGDAFIL
jgi:hypothetical protein